MGKTKHLKIRSDWVVSNENEYSISTMTLRFLFKSHVSCIESLKFESNQYQIAWYLNRIAQCLNRIFVAIQIAIESNRDLISPITGLQPTFCRRDVRTADPSVCERRSAALFLIRRLTADVLWTKTWRRGLSRIPFLDGQACTIFW